MLPWWDPITSCLRRPSRSSMSGSTCTQMVKDTCTRNTAAISLRVAQVSCQAPMMREWLASLPSMTATEMARSRDSSSSSSTRTQVETSLTQSERTWEPTISEATWRSWVRSKRKVPSRLRTCLDTRSQRIKNILTSLWLYLIDRIQFLRLLGT